MKNKILVIFAVFMSLLALNAHAKPKYLTERFNFEAEVLFDENQAIIKPKDDEQIGILTAKVLDMHRGGIEGVFREEFRKRNNVEISEEQLSKLYETSDLDYELVLEGHMDKNEFNQNKNKELPLRRIKAVQKRLLEHFEFSGLTYDEKDFIIKNYGATKPVATNKTEKGKAMNRRVVAKFTFVWKYSIDKIK